MPRGEFVDLGLLEPLRRTSAKLLLLVAPAGYGKSTAAAALASRNPGADILDDADRMADCEGELRRIWIEKPDALAIVCSRKPLVVPFALALPHEVRLIRADELRVTRAAIGQLFAPLSASAAQIDMLDAATLGWPAAVLAARNRARERDVATVIDDLATLADRPVEQYIAGNVLPSLSGEARSLLLLASFKPLTFADADALLGDRCETALDEVKDSFLVRHPSDGTYLLHPMLKTAIDLRFRGDACASSALLGEAYERARQPLRAARWYLRAGAVARANAAYNQQTLAKMALISKEDSTAAAEVDDASLIENLAIFNIAAVEQLYTRDYSRWFAMAEEALHRAPAEVPAGVRALAINTLVSRYAYFGHFDDARRVLNEQSALFGEAPEYQMTLGLCDAFIRAMHDEFVDIADLRRRLSPLLLDPYGRAGFASVAAYTYGVQGNWPAGRSEWEAMVGTLERSRQAMHAAEALMAAAFFAWLYGDDRSFRDWLGRLEETGAVAGSAFFIRSVRGVDASAALEYETPQVRVYAYLIAASSESDTGAARRLGRHALLEAERTGRPFFCVLAHLALGFLEADDANEHVAKARALAKSIPSPELQRAVAAVHAGGDDAGMLTAFRGRYMRARRGEGLLCINVLTGAIEWEDKPLGLNERPRQVIVALALCGIPLRGEELASRIWPDREPMRMQNALRVHIAAIRKASDPSVIVYDDGCYRITTSHVVDLDDAERLVRQATHGVPLGASMRRTLEEMTGALDSRFRRWDDLDWFSSVQRRADALWRTAIVTLAEDALHRHDSAAAIHDVNRLIERDACDERARSIAIRAHVQSGHETEAAREYRDYCRAVHEELGVELAPGAESDEALGAFVNAMRR